MTNNPVAASYENSGVNKKEGYRAVEKMKSVVRATHGKAVISGLGAFASLYALEGWKEPVLVAGSDGVGTKLRLALDAGNLEVIGRDCYAMVANDILCHGARPLFFLDYLACGSLDADKAAAIVSGMAAACREEGCALVGGETAEMPGFYAPGDYDVAGFAVGAVERSEMITGERVQPGDVIIGLASNGIHSNGYSLVRSLFPNTVTIFQNKPLIETLLLPTRLYGNSIRHLLNSGVVVHGMAHITGGGLPENIPRAFPGSGLEACIEVGSWPEPPIFGLIRAQGVSEDEMRGTFNMGIGFVLVVPESDADLTVRNLASLDQSAWRIGTVGWGENGLCYV